MSNLLLFALFLSSCSPLPEKDNQADNLKQKAEADKALAAQKLQQLLASKQEQARQEAEQARIEEEKAALVAKPHYDPIRLRRAAAVKQWTVVTVPELNIDAWLKTTWKDGKMNLRLALMGQQEALNLFNSSWPVYRLTFADQSGTNINQVRIPTSEMHWASGTKNGGVPTLEFEGSEDCQLEIYEQCVQWNFRWEQ